MKHPILTRSYAWVIGLLIACGLPLAAQAQSDESYELIMELKTSSYATNGESNSIQFLLGSTEAGVYVDLNCGNGLEEKELEPATYDANSQTWTGSLITCNVSNEDIIRVYGDPSKINLLMADGCYIRKADLSKLTSLYYLNLCHNELEELDLTNLSNLSALYIDDNPFNVKAPVIGPNKPNLMILEMGQSTHVDPNFNLSDYPAMVAFDAMSNYGLTKLDPTGCPNLKRLSIDCTNVKTLDVSHNPDLRILNISETGITDIDLSNNPNLEQFYADHQSGSINAGVKLRALDLTHNPNLLYLFAAGNNFKDIDISHNLNLQNLYIANNLLTSIDLSKHEYLINVILRNNCFDFKTLPLPNDLWNDYDYIQRNMPVNLTYTVGDKLDLSDRVLRDGYETTCALYRTSEADPNLLEVLDDSYYTYDNGVITFLKETTDSVFVAFACNAFPAITLESLPLRTNKLIVKSAEDFGAADTMATFTMPLNLVSGTTLRIMAGIVGAGEDTPKEFYVDFGDGVTHTYTATSEQALAEAKGKVKFGKATLTVPQDTKLSALAVDGVTLTGVDLSPARQLTELSLTNTGLTAIDLGWNRALRKLVLTGNALDSLNIRGVNDGYQKTLLTDINLSNNGLKSVTLNDNYTIHHLNLSHNALTELSFKDADMMETVDLSYNQLTELDFNYCTIMTELNVANNQLTSVVLPSDNQLEKLNLANNQFDFATLPLLSDLKEYTYAPQNEISIPTIGPGANLRSNNIGGLTSYTWKEQDTNATFTPGTDYTLEDGKTRFLSPMYGKKAYCVFTNPAFPELTLTTNVIEAAGMPTHLLGTFTTTEASEGRLIMRAKSRKTNICIDWQGDGIELEQFVVMPQNSEFAVKSVAGAKAKIYSYSAAENSLSVFSISDIKMSELDLTPMTGLTMIAARNAGLLSLKSAPTAPIAELNLDGNNFSEVDFSHYPDLMFLMLNSNKFTTFDATPYANLQLLGLNNNQLSEVTLDNPKLWSLALSDNQLTDVSFAKLPELNQVWLDGNQLSSVSIEGLNQLKVLVLDRNRFTFSTLPLPSEQFAQYVYGNQADIDITLHNGRVDLSAEATIDGTPTEYTWWIGKPTTDDNGELVGEQLYVDDEYGVEKGVTTFYAAIDGVLGMLTNEKFPDLVLYTTAIDTDVPEGIHDVTSTTASAIVRGGKGHVSCLSPAGTAIKVYGADGREERSLTADHDTTTIALQPGVHIVVVGQTAFKAIVR